MMETIHRKVLIGVGVGLTAMVICAGLMFLLLLLRRNYLQRDDKYVNRMAVPYNGTQNAGDNMDMSRTMAWSPRHGASPDPTLHPLHGQNDPFFHRDRNNYTGSGHSSTLSSGRSNGHIAIVPFRESGLPVSDTSYTQDGRLGRGLPRKNDYDDNYSGGRIHRNNQHRNNSEDRHFETYNEDLSNNSPRSYTQDNRYTRDYYRKRQDSPRRNYQHDYGLAPDTPSDISREEQRIVFPNGRNNANRDSSHLHDVYY